MPLTDGVVTLRHPVTEDAPHVAAAVRDSLPELQMWMTWATSDYDVATARQWIFDEFDPGSERFVVTHTDNDDEILGSCGLGPIDTHNRVIEIGYWIRTDQTGRGLATRAASLLARHAIHSRHAVRVEIRMSVENRASQRVAEKVGAHHEGVLRARLLLNGEHHDVDLWSILAEDLQGR